MVLTSCAEIYSPSESTCITAGGQSGFMATRDEEKFVMEFPSRLFGLAPHIQAG